MTKDIVVPPKCQPPGSGRLSRHASRLKNASTLGTAQVRIALSYCGGSSNGGQVDPSYLPNSGSCLVP